MTYTLRPFDFDELAAVVEMMNSSYADFGTDSSVRPEHLKLWLTDLNYELHIMTTADSALVGSVSFSYDSEIGIFWGEMTFAPGHRRADVMHTLLDFAEERARLRVSETAARPVDIRFSVNRTADDVISIFEARGYEYIRSAYRMSMTLDQPIPDPVIPAGIELRPYDRERDLRAAHAAFVAAFSEHYGFQAESFESWQQGVLSFPGDDQSLWLMAWEGEQAVGFSFNRALVSRPNAVWVSDIGVLKSHRQRGLGEALLKSSFKLFQARGYTWVGLGVDAANHTGALRLYERAGMSVYLEFLSYRKLLLPAD